MVVGTWTVQIVGIANGRRRVSMANYVLNVLESKTVTFKDCTRKCVVRKIEPTRILVRSSRSRIAKIYHVYRGKASAIRVRFSSFDQLHQCVKHIKELLENCQILYLHKSATYSSQMMSSDREEINLADPQCEAAVTSYIKSLSGSGLLRTLLEEIESKIEDMTESLRNEQPKF